MPEMKDSGIEWVGEIPKDWKINRIKNVISILTDYTANGSFGDLAKNVHYLNGEGYARLVRLTGLREDLNNDNGVYVDESAYKYLSKSSLYGNEILIANVGAYAGFFCLMPKNKGACTLGPNMFLIRTNKHMLTKFLFYLGQSKTVWEQLRQKANATAQPKLNKNDIKNTFICMPPIKRQYEIVDFLDSKCSEIDALTADIQKEIDILEEYKKSVITEAVTKGLNPNAEMKDSGIEWVGKIPKEWKIIPIRYLFSEVTRKNSLLQAKKALKFTYGTIIPKKDFEADTDEYVSRTMATYTIVSPGMIMINCLNLNYDFVSQRIGLVNDNGAITSAYLAIKPSENVVPRFANYQLKSWDAKKAFHNMGSGVRKTLDFSELGKKYFPLPPLTEQTRIADFLDSKCSEIDDAIVEKREQLTTLAEYKKSLIYEYVTGKKEVTAQ